NYENSFKLSGLPAANPFRPTVFRQTKAAPGAAHICPPGRPAAHSAAARNVIPPLTPFWRETRVYANNRGLMKAPRFLEVQCLGGSLGLYGRGKPKPSH